MRPGAGLGGPVAAEPKLHFSAVMAAIIRPKQRKASLLAVGDAVEQLLKKVPLTAREDGRPVQGSAQRRCRAARSQIAGQDCLAGDGGHDCLARCFRQPEVALLLRLAEHGQHRTDAYRPQQGDCPLLAGPQAPPSAIALIRRRRMSNPAATAGEGGPGRGSPFMIAYRPELTERPVCTHKRTKVERVGRLARRTGVWDVRAAAALGCRVTANRCFPHSPDRSRIGSKNPG